MEKIKVEVVIPVFNEAENIKFLLDSILIQNDDNYILESITILNDASTDNTVDIINKYNNKLINLIDYKTRAGKYRGLNDFYPKAKSDIIIHCDGDVILEQNAFKNIVQDFLNDTNISLVCGNIKPIRVKSYIEKIVYVSEMVMGRIKEKLEEKGNLFNRCNGRLYAVRKAFGNKIHLPANRQDDGYIYLFAVSSGEKVVFCKESIAYFKMADNLRDWLIQMVRYRNQVVASYFNKELIKQYVEIPLSLKVSSVLYFFPRKPVGIIVYLSIFILSVLLAKIRNSKEPSWRISNSTKNLQK